MKTKRWHSNHGFRTVLVATRGRKFISLIVIEADGLRLSKVPLTEERFITDIGRSTKKSWRSIARKPGTTKGAKKALRSLLAA